MQKHNFACNLLRQDLIKTQILDWHKARIYNINLLKAFIYLGWGNPKHRYRLSEWLEDSPEEKDLCMLIDE